ncbi:CHAT domain-containing tetratricopeptide repeat protein [Planktothrix sp. FACHB-1365]|uniref:CHAT domain-containing protein n=1 Tax=Planktothrix sp. FACHB-1365 TaxID=2692855 RepID=UPI0016821AFD|nr:CHAT domain-containing tetratricopeptide repeat protein [Planktothrix sp. FACHB-1365]MBD2483685.1 CHAT domain-containing protein [Planktothrix sp. FACHB-1365]
MTPEQKKAEADRLLIQGVEEYYRSQYRQALQSSQQALTIYREIGDRGGEGSALGNLGIAYCSLGQYQQAIDYHQQGLTIAREIGDRHGEGSDLGSLGNAYSSLGQYQLAIEYYQQGLTIAREIGDRHGEGNALGNLGIAYRFLGQYQQAIDYYQQALTIAREIGDRRGEGTALGNLGIAYCSLGQYQQAIDYHQQGLTIAREIGDRHGEGSDLGSLGNAYSSLGQYQLAIEYYQQGLTIAREIGDRHGEGNALGNLGNAYDNLGQYQPAIDYYQQYLTIAREIGDRHGEGNALGNLGNAYDDLGQYQLAIEYYQQHLTIAREIGDRSGEFSGLNNLALTYKNLQQIPQALETWQSALALSSPLKFPVQYLSIGRNLGYTAFEVENWQLAITGYEAALDALEELCHRDPSDANKQQRRSENVRVYERLVQAYLHQNQIDKALITLERGKSRSLIELLVNRDLLPKNTPPEICQRLEQLRRELSANQRFIESLGGDIPTSGIDPDSPQSRSAGGVNLPIDSINQIRETLVQQKQELNQVLEQIKIFDPTFEYTQRVQRINSSEILALLPEKTALVEWFVASERIYAFIVWSDPPQPPLEKGEKDDQSSFRADYWQSKPEAVTAVVELRDRYLETYNSKTDIWENQLEPFLEELAEILNINEILSKIPSTCQRLILVPYRELHLFPLHALPVAKENGKTLCLFDQFSKGVQYLPSLQMGLMSLKNTELREKNPDYAVNNIQLFAIQNPTKDLTFAELEVDAIASQFTANILSREKATKIALTQPPNSDLFRDANYLHFACHGSFNFEFPLLSHLILAGGIVEVFESSDRQTQEKLDPPETVRYLPWRKGKQVDTNQCYTLREIFSLYFPKGELVTLSACETGLTQFDQTLEEYISLPSGFLFAGVKNVICSLWRVSDLSTAILMIKFYELFRSEKSVSLALNQAQSWLRTVDKENLLKWLDALKLKPEPKQKLRQQLNLGLRSSTYQPFKEAYYWAGFCAIGT